MNSTDLHPEAVFLKEIPQFKWHDYLAFVVLLLISTLIGIYFGFIKKKPATKDEYFLGSKSMGVIEISMSLIASTISGQTILITPSEVYRFGSQFWFAAVAMCGVIPFYYKYVLPIFAKLQTASTFEYLNNRFDKNIRRIASVLYTLFSLVYIPFVTYIPVLALAQVTGFNISFTIPVICAVCIFYTAIGGLKTVVWTDTLQLVMMTGASIAVIVLGTVSGNGVKNILKDAYDGGRLNLDFDSLPTKRDTFWTILIGMWFFWHGFVSFGQGFTQKCLALPNTNKIRTANIIFLFGLMLFFLFSAYIGLMIYAKYKNCDPFTSKQINLHDQILPLYILDVTGSIAGLPGIFIAGVFSASLSSFSAQMNALACTIYEDFIRGCLPKDIPQKKINLIFKSLIILIGIICTALIYLVQNFHSLLEVGITLVSFTQGPVIGLFSLGMFVPKANTKGAWAGVITSTSIMAWLVFTTLYYKWEGYILQPSLTVSVDECILPPNTTFRNIPIATEWTPPAIYRISHYYYTLMGTGLVFLIGVPISYLTQGKKKTAVSKDLISPIMHWALKDDEYYNLRVANQNLVVDGVQ